MSIAKALQRTEDFDERRFLIKAAYQVIVDATHLIELLTALKPSSSEGIPEQPQTNSSTQHLSNSPLRSILLPARRSSA
jgi:hypothetical protein